MAPEILEGEEEYDYKCDLWSIGVIIYQMYFKDFPYKGQTAFSLLHNIKKVGRILKSSNDNKLE